MSTKIIQFSHAPTLDVRVVRTPMGTGCSKCAFRWASGYTCPNEREERRVAGGACAVENHHYEEVKR